MNIVSQPDNAQHFTGHPFILVCHSQIHEAVDTDVNVTITWSGPREKTSSRTLSPVPGMMLEFKLPLEFSLLDVSDSGNYSCDSTVYPVTSPYLVKSDTSSTSFVISPSKLSMDPIYLHILVHALL